MVRPYVCNGTAVNSGLHDVAPSRVYHTTAHACLNGCVLERKRGENFYVLICMWVLVGTMVPYFKLLSSLLLGS